MGILYTLGPIFNYFHFDFLEIHRLIIMSYSVRLYVYDISNGFGIYHTSVVVHNVEIVFNAHGLLIHRMVS